MADTKILILDCISEQMTAQCSPSDFSS